MAHRKLVNQAVSGVVAVIGGLAFLGAEHDVVLSAAIFLLIGLAMAVWIHRRLPGWTHVAPLPAGAQIAPVWWTIAAGVLQGLLLFAPLALVSVLFWNAPPPGPIAFVVGFVAGNGLGMRKTTRYEREHPDRVLVARVRPYGENPTWAAPRS